MLELKPARDSKAQTFIYPSPPSGVVNLEVFQVVLIFKSSVGVS
jgi:hypothetical protein